MLDAPVVSVVSTSTPYDPNTPPSNTGVSFFCINDPSSLIVLLPLLFGGVAGGVAGGVVEDLLALEPLWALGVDVDFALGSFSADGEVGEADGEFAAGGAVAGVVDGVEDGLDADAEGEVPVADSLVSLVISGLAFPAELSLRGAGLEVPPGSAALGSDVGGILVGGIVLGGFFGDDNGGGLFGSLCPGSWTSALAKCTWPCPLFKPTSLMAGPTAKFV